MIVLVSVMVVGVVSGQVSPAPAPPAAAPAPAPAPAPDKPAVPQERPRVLVLDLEAVQVDPGQARVINGVLTDALGQYDSLELISQQDLRTLAELESERAAVGCESTSCLAEIAAAMGATYVVFGSIGTLGQSTLIQLNLFDSEAAKPVGRETARSARVDDIAADVEEAAGKLVAGLVTAEEVTRAAKRVTEIRASAPAPPTPTVVDEAAEASPLLFYSLLGSGAGLAVAGTAAAVAASVFFVWANLALTTDDAPRFTKDVAFIGGWVSVGVVAVGLVGLVAGGGLAAYAFLE